MSIARGLFLLLGVVFIGTMAVLPFIIPRDMSIARVALHSQTAQVEDATEDGYPVPMTEEEAANVEPVGGIEPLDHDIPRTDESQDYIDEHGYGWAPCMDLGTCNEGSLKDGPAEMDTYSGDEEDAYSYGGWGSNDRYSYESWDEYYAPSTGHYVASGLSQVPSILSNVIFPQAQQQTIYTTSYVPQQVQTYTYAQPVTQNSYTYTEPQQASFSTQSFASYTAPQASFVPVAQAITPPSTYVQPTTQGSYSSPGGYTQRAIQYQAPITTNTVTSGYAVATLKPTIIAKSVPAVAVSGSVVSAPATPQPTCTLTAKPLKIPLGATSTLSWTSGRGEARMNPWGLLDASGSKVLAPTTTTTYLLTVSGDNDTRKTCSATITVDAAICASVCPPGYTCTPNATGGTTVVSGGTSTPAKKSFWSWLGF